MLEGPQCFEELQYLLFVHYIHRVDPDSYLV